MTPSAPERTVPDLTGLLLHAGHVLSTRLTAALADLGVTPREFCVLWHAMEDERTQIQLAELADLDKTTMVVTVDRLEKAGLAERKAALSDRRARVIVVTEAGARVVRHGTKIVDRVHGEVLAALPGNDGEIFARSLAQLTGGHLAEPVECEQPVRRARQAS
jgi:MarR family transcriptional regulator for hemolysin